MNYDDFIQSKVKRVLPHGFEPRPIHAPLFPWQKHVTEWAIRQGRAALFEDCGLGKTLQQLEWSRQVAEHTGGAVIILTPLAVAAQTLAEAHKFGIEARIVRQPEQVAPGINITNYEKLDHFDAREFAGVVLDESSILKNFTGKTRIRLTERFAGCDYRLCCTATPSPNDYTEFGQHADFLGICSPAQMLATFFLNDTFNTGDWRLKKHAEVEFWNWLGSWAACIGKPSDIGFDDAGYNLPPLRMETITVDVDERAADGSEELFKHATLSATTMHRELRETAAHRAQAVADMVNASDEQWLVWCNTNAEEEELIARIPTAVAVRGSDHPLKKEKAAKWFKGEICACNEHEFRYKLSEWKKIISKNITSGTETGSSRSQRNTIKQTEKSELNTQRTTTINIAPCGTSEQENSKTRSTPQNERNTSPTNLLDFQSEPKQKSGRQQIHSNEKLNESKNTDSLLISSNPCLQSSVENAPSVERFQTSSELTTATQRGTSEACCASHVISDSENSTIIPTSSDQQRCICGKTTNKRILISKSSIFGYGLNLQCCRNVAFVGLSYSFEDFYQALRRSYRFGQEREVNAYIVQARTEGAILSVVKHKIEQHARMQEQMKVAALALRKKEKTILMKTDIEKASGDGWELYHGDCVRVAANIERESVGISVFSPPFADLFTYSADVQDMGNCDNKDEFANQFKFLITEIYRVTKPGRMACVHCLDLLSTKWKHGKIEFQDFSGDIVRAFRETGFAFHSRVTIWKDPVTEMQRTKAHGLLYKTLLNDSTSSRMGSPEYLLIFKKPGENVEPVTHTKESFNLDQWQEWASPVWTTIDQGNVLNKALAREDNDERHICPLQLDVIERALVMWSNPGDLVYSPFAGIGSEGYQALRMDRKFIGSELKESYFKQACRFLESAKSQLNLFAA